MGAVAPPSLWVFKNRLEKHVRNDICRAAPALGHGDGLDDLLRSLPALFAMISNPGLIITHPSKPQR